MDLALTLAMRMLGNREEAEETAQDAFVRAYRSLHSFREDAAFSTWLYRIVHNLCLTRISRRRPATQAVELRDGEVPDILAADESDPSVQEQMEDEELQAAIAAQIALLPEKFRSVVVLFYQQEMSYEEIAGILGVPLGTVKTNLFRGRAMLRQRVLGKLNEENV